MIRLRNSGKISCEIKRRDSPSEYSYSVQAVINYAKIKGGVGGKILARETIAAYRKDVLQNYTEGMLRENKAFDKQKKGKKRMKRFGNVEIPQEAFLAVLKI